MSFRPGPASRTRLRLETLESRTAPAAGFYRVASYNITASDGTPAAGLSTILQAIGNESVGGLSQPVDLLLLQEVDHPTGATETAVSLLNGLYGAGVYARGNVNASSTGAGTQGVVYNSQKLQLLNETAVGVASTSGQPRQALRYQFQPVGYSGASFFVYNSHFKANDDADSESRRLIEAQAIRLDSDALGNVPVLYVGDFNMYRSADTAYQQLLSAGAGQAFDPLNRPGNWHESSSFRDIMTQAPAVNPPAGLTGGGLDDRFDFQLVSNELFDGVGFEYVANSYHTFGNNGSVALNGNINDPSNTALAGLVNRTTVLDFLTTVTDHLPVVADYQVVAAAGTPTTTTLISGSNPANQGMGITFTATVSGVGGTPTGTVILRDGSTPIGTAALSGGVATFSIGTLTPGIHTLTAVYSGGTPFTGSSSAAVDQSVVNPFASFAPGNIVVTMVGNGSTALSTAAAPVTLREYTSAGALVRGVPLPSTGPGAVTVAGSSRFEGFLSRSTDTRYLTLAGFVAASGTAAIDDTASAATPRVVARIDRFTNFDFTTRLGVDYSGLGFDGAVTDNGTRYWTWGEGVSGNTGLRVIGHGNTASNAGTQLQSSVFSPRQVTIAGGQLYLASSFLNSSVTTVTRVGLGLPTSGSLALTTLPGMPTTSGPSPFGFVLMDRNPAVPGLDTAYVADDRVVGAGGGLQRWSFNGTTWALQYTLTAGLTAGLRGLAGTTDGLNRPVFYATTADTATRLVAITDTGAGAGFSILATAPANTAFRGVALAPGRFIPSPVAAQDVATGSPIFTVPEPSFGGMRFFELPVKNSKDPEKSFRWSPRE